MQRAGGYSSLQCGGFSCCGAWALDAWASVVVARGLHSAGSVVVVHGLSCSAACGIFLDQGSNPCPLNWQADSYPLCHQGSPDKGLFKKLRFLDFNQHVWSLNTYGRLADDFFHHLFKKQKLQVSFCI